MLDQIDIQIGDKDGGQIEIDGWIDKVTEHSE